MFLRYPGGLTKALTFSYDDGVEQDMRLVKLLDDHGMKGTFNLNSGLFSPQGTTFAPGTMIQSAAWGASGLAIANSTHAYKSAAPAANNPNNVHTTV